MFLLKITFLANKTIDANKLKKNPFLKKKKKKSLWNCAFPKFQNFINGIDSIYFFMLYYIQKLILIESKSFCVLKSFKMMKIRGLTVACALFVAVVSYLWQLLAFLQHTFHFKNRIFLLKTDSVDNGRCTSLSSLLF